MNGIKGKECRTCSHLRDELAERTRSLNLVFEDRVRCMTEMHLLETERDLYRQTAWLAKGSLELACRAWEKLQAENEEIRKLWQIAELERDAALAAARLAGKGHGEETIHD